MDYRKMTEYRNDHNNFTKRLGMVLEYVGPGAARVVKTISEDDLNPLGRPHGGVYFTMADFAAGSAMASHGYAAVTMNANYNFFRSANTGETVTAEAKEVKSGQTVCVYDVQVTGENGILLGSGTFTFFRLEEKLAF